jgi:hypothetical protein
MWDNAPKLAKIILVLLGLILLFFAGILVLDNHHKSIEEQRMKKANEEFRMKNRD